MSLSSGTKLGPYEIVAPLGAGGMGEVYKARDTRLDRTVAIKVLPAHVADRVDLRQRFEREARAVSALNHPNICTLHDIGQQDGIDFLVMEYLEGETLAARLAKGSLAADQLLRYAIQIADALGQAHKQGVFHRDLKPGNIMLTKAGAKLLDFGLAKLRGPESSSVVIGASGLPTVEAGLTQKGTILGTFQYMAPEQLEGKESDARADIFSFGAVVYEMATGRKAFTGTSHASLIASILSSQPPPISTVQPIAPPALDRVVQRCLAKDPDERWQTALDLASELKWIAGGSGSDPSASTIKSQIAPAAAAPVPAPPPIRQRLPWALAAVAAFAAVALAIAYFHRPAPDVRAIKLSLLPPEKGAFASISISPDGRRIAFAGSQSGKTQLWIRPLDSLTAQPLAGTEDASYPFWSPDSRFIGFFAQGKLKKIDASGGPPQTLCDAASGRGGAWNRDGVIIFAAGGGSGLSRVQAAGGEVKPLTALAQSHQENSHRWPWFLPDGKHYLYFVRSSQRDNSGIYLGTLDSKDKTRLLGDDSNVAYAAAPSGSGHLLFARNSILMAQPFDAAKLQLAGDPFPAAEQTGFDAGFSRGDFAVSENGVLVYDPTPTSSQDQLTWFNRDGKRLGTVGPAGTHWQPALSPDEKTVAVDQLDAQAGAWDIYAIDLARDISTRLTFDPKTDIFPRWSADGSRIAFISNRTGPYNVYQKMSSGAGEDELILKAPNWHTAYDFSRDGRFLLYGDQDPKTKWDLWVLSLSGDRKPIPFLRTEFNEYWSRFSPDGKWIAYASDESKKDEVYVQSFPPSGGKWQISTGGGSFPQWRRDGKELFYLSADKKIMAVEVSVDSTFHAGVPKALFDTRIPNTGFPAFAVTGDGQRFLMPTLLGESAAPQPAAVVLNWTAAIKR